MSEWPPELGARTAITHMANLQRLRAEVRSEILLRIFATAWRYALAPLAFAFGRRMCSSSRGRISTKLHGR